MSDAVNRLYLVRHGENLANITKEFSHRHIDYPLTAKGVLQAQQTAEHFVGRGIHEVYSSPLKRARQTAEIIADRLGLEVTVLEELREINVGELETQPVSIEGWQLFREIALDWLAGRHAACFPGGEDYAGLWARMRRAVETMVAGKGGRNIVVVGHGGIYTFTLKDLCPGIDTDWLRRSVTHNCAISELAVRLRDGRLEAELIAWACHDHLHGAAAELVDATPRDDSFLKRK